jgi:tetratricopeptide (TPR) repeat protein
VAFHHDPATMPSERVQRQIDRLLTEAETALANGHWDIVRTRADAVLRLDPGNGDARAYLEAAGRPSSVAAEADDPGSPGASGPAVALASKPVPASFASGRYTVKKFLGEGGKKKVYLAHDNTLDRDVAFALIKSEALDEVSRQRVTREAQAMGRLGDHPNIMPIFDLGQEKDPATGGTQPCMVLPVMGGGDVGEAIEKAPDHRMPLERAVQIAKDTCEGLVFAHGKGVVHRDLKPGNVWLTERGVARIGDFGLAVATDRSRLTREAMMVGTVAYMPPEQAMGGEITPRADLYSLGCMLYEMVTGRPPFLGDDDISIIGQHINTPPVAPSWHRHECPKPLEALIMRLLAKDPAQRPESATDVLVALAGVESASLKATEAGTRHGQPSGEKAEPPEARSLDSMSSGVFVGRHKEMDQLRAGLEEALSGRGRMVTLVGEPGIGKTRIAQELTTYAGLRRCQVLWGRCYEGGGAPPYWPWVQAVRQYTQERSPEELRRDLGSHASVIAEIVVDLKDKLPGIQPPAQLESAEAARFRLFDSITTFLKNASRAQSLVVVLDDLHWADKPSLLLLEFIARELANSRVLLVGAYRDVELNRRHPLAITLGDLTKERLFERILLRGLQKPDVSKFIELAAGTQPPGGLVDAVFTQTEGNPLFVTEVVRILVQEGELRPDKRSTGDHKTTTWMVRIPEGVKEVIGRRLDRLSERCNETLTVAAVIGRQFSLKQLLAVVNDATASAEERTSESRMLDVLEEALASRVAEELPDAVGRYQFSHALIQETLLGELSITRRVRLHARIAEALERLHGEEAPAHAAELAAQFVSAEAVLGNVKLVSYSQLAGDQALAACAHEEALDHFQRALTSLRGAPMAPTRARLLAGRGAAFAALTRIPEALADLQAAFDFYDHAGDVNSALKVARTRIVTGEGQRGIAPMLRRAVELADPDSADRATIQTYLGRVTGLLGDYETSKLLIEGAIETASRIGDKSLELRALADRAFVDYFNLRDDSMERHARRGIEIAPLVAEPLAESQLRMFMAHLLANRGDRPGAQREYEAAVTAANRAGDRDRLSTVHNVMCRAAMLRGEFTAARKFSDLSIQYSPTYAVALAQRCTIEFLTGQFDAAAPFLERYGSGYDRMPQHDAHLFFDLGEIGQSRSLTDRAMAVGSKLADSSHVNAFEALLHWNAQGERAIQVGDRNAARNAYSLARKLGAADFTFWDCVSVNTRLGRMAAFCSMREDAERHFDDARRACETAGYRTSLAWNEYYRAQFLQGLDEDSARKRADVSLNEALSVARELGMRPLVERILAQRKILQA